jgi:hypothetical protein
VAAGGTVIPEGVAEVRRAPSNYSFVDGYPHARVFRVWIWRSLAVMCAACFAHGLETQQERIGGSRTAQQLKTFNRGCTQMDEDSPRCNVAELFAFICVHLWLKILLLFSLLPATPSTGF